jgi:hypothetical protein
MSGTEPRSTGRWCWHFIAEGWDGDDDTWHARLSTGRSLLTMPLGDGSVYCYADLTTGNGREPGDWRNYFEGFGKPINDLLAQAGQVYGTAITEVDQPYASLSPDCVGRRRCSRHVTVDGPWRSSRGGGRAGAGGDAEQPSGREGVARVRATAGSAHCLDSCADTPPR